MHLTLDYWRPHQDPEVWQQEPDVLGSNMSEDNFVGEAEEALVQIT